MKETWKEIQEYKGLYEISNFGRVKCLAKIVIMQKMGRREERHRRPEKIMRCSDMCGYRSICLTKNGKGRTFLVHRLVAMAFIPNPECKEQVNHIDGDKRNNRVDNLEWATRFENIRHSWKIGLRKPLVGENRHNSKLTATQVTEIRGMYREKKYNGVELAKMFNVTYGNIYNIVNRKNWKHLL